MPKSGFIEPVYLSPFAIGGVARWPLTARVERAPLYRARSASKKGCLATTPFFSHSVLEERLDSPSKLASRDKNNTALVLRAYYGP